MKNEDPTVLLAKTRDETRYCLDLFGFRPVDCLEQVEWLAGDVWLAHGIHFDTPEIWRIGTAGVGVCHCPSSNMVLASGICPALERESAGSPVGLGVDGSASNDGSNLLQEVGQSLLLQRLKYGSSKVSHRDVLGWATRGRPAAWAGMIGVNFLWASRPIWPCLSWMSCVFPARATP